MSLPNRVHEKAARPEVLPGIVALPFEEVPCDMDRALALEVAHHAGNRQLWRNVDQHVDMIGQQVSLLDPTAFLFGQPMKHPAKFSTHDAKERSTPILRDKYDVVFALPFGVTQTAIVLHGIWVGCAALVGSQLTPRGGLPDKSNSESLPGKAGGTPIGSLGCFLQSTAV